MFASRLFFFVKKRKTRLKNDDIYPHLRFCNYLDGGAGIDDGGLDEPGQPQAKQDVEYVAADGIAHRHVPWKKIAIYFANVQICAKNFEVIFYMEMRNSLVICAEVFSYSTFQI